MQADLSQLMAFELKREGMDVNVGRGGPTAPAGSALEDARGG